MDPAKPTSELVIAKVKDGSNLGQPGSSGGDKQAFMDLVVLVNSQNGVSRQSWGFQIEDREQFVWQVEWEAYEQTLEWVTSPAHATFVASAAQVFNFSAQPPVILYSQWNGDATATVKAPVTELSFFSLPLNMTEEEKQSIIMEIEKLDRAAVDVGQATAAVNGHAIQTVRGVQKPGGYYSGQSGWQSVEASQKWRESFEYANAGTVLTAANFPGVNQHTGHFQVSFTTS